ncbi:hypothetical protein C8J56DRAFT_885722 [Mycena floridula]|nr:hypothetical protein C8J56DRAFT_885722 [Mycena floridula]
MVRVSWLLPLLDTLLRAFLFYTRFVSWTFMGPPASTETCISMVKIQRFSRHPIFPNLPAPLHPIRHLLAALVQPPRPDTRHHWFSHPGLSKDLSCHGPWLPWDLGQGFACVNGLGISQNLLESIRIDQLLTGSDRLHRCQQQGTEFAACDVVALQKRHDVHINWLIAAILDTAELYLTAFRILSFLGQFISTIDGGSLLDFSHAVFLTFLGGDKNTKPDVPPFINMSLQVQHGCGAITKYALLGNL